MYVFGIDIPLNALFAIGLALHLIEFILALLILQKVRRNVLLHAEKAIARRQKRANPSDEEELKGRTQKRKE